LKPRRRLLETMEKFGLQCNVSVNVCVASKGEAEMYPAILKSIKIIFDST